MVVGDQRTHLTALVVVDDAGLARYWQKEKGSDLPADWRSEPGVHAWLLDRMHAAYHDLPSFMQVRDFVLVGDEWTQTSGMLTPTLKFKRRMIMQQHQAEIDGMYEGEDQGLQQ
ncbi:MAG: long-chain fatty acid--CoA ligase, partial [Mariprofundaceae bacterium]|nr:long-chain fatty acid--CoA ligase [Mariprofundaceae bacterium]